MGKPARHELIKDHAQRIDIRPRIDPVRSAFDLLGCGPGQGTEKLPCAADKGILCRRPFPIPFRDLGKAEVEDVRFAAVVHKNIAGLQIAMNDAIPVRMPHRLADLHKKAEH